MPDATPRLRDDRKDGPGRVVAFPRAGTPGRPPDSLPVESSSFVGREREVAEIEKLLASSRDGGGARRAAGGVGAAAGSSSNFGLAPIRTDGYTDPPD